MTSPRRVGYVEGGVTICEGHFLKYKFVF
jgi:hypothetical protein